MEGLDRLAPLIAKADKELHPKVKDPAVQHFMRNNKIAKGPNPLSIQKKKTKPEKKKALRMVCRVRIKARTEQVKDLYDGS